MSTNTYLHLGDPLGHLLRHQGPHHKLLRGKKIMIIYTPNIFVVEHHHMQYLNQNIKLSNYVSICTDVKSKPARGVLPQGGRFDPLERSPYLSCNFNLPFPWQDYLQMISFLAFLYFSNLSNIICILRDGFRKFICFGIVTRP